MTPPPSPPAKINSASASSPSDDEEQAKLTPGLTIDWSVVMTGVERLLPAIYSLDASLNTINHELLYVQNIVQEFPFSGRTKQRLYEDKLAEIVDKVVEAFEVSQPRNAHFWLHTIDVATKGMLRQLDTIKLSPRAKRALSTVFDTSTASLRFRLCPSPQAPSPPPSAATPARDGFKPLTIVFDADADFDEDRSA
jgi:hypothetical protein